MGSKGLPANATAARARVTSRLLAATSYPITMMIAPAGFGKTTALSHLLAKTKGGIFIATPPATDLKRFVQIFATACTPIIPEMATPPNEPVSPENNIESAVDLYCAWASLHLCNTNCTIAVDDLQNVDHDEAVAMFLSRIAEASKGHIKWIFSSRTRGNLPTTRWQAYGDADEPVTADDLRITFEEAQFLAKSLNSPATAEQIKQWVNQTRGFAMPIAYAIRVSAHRATAENIMDGARAVTFSFLAEQLWESLTIVERELLEVAAFLPIAHMHDYENAGIRNASSIISQLCDGIAFLSLAAGNFSMHDLFRDFIRQRVTLSGPEMQRLRVTEAVKVLFLSARHSEAFQLLIDWGYIADLLDAIECHPNASLDLSVTQKIVEATSHLKPAQLGIQLLYLHTEHWSWIGEMRRARICADETIKRQEARSMHLLCAIFAICKVVYHESALEHRRWLSTMPSILKRLDETDRIQASAYQAMFLARYPESQPECRSLIQQIQMHIGTLDLEARVTSLIGIGSALFYLREFDEALSAYRESVTAAQTLGDVRQFARALNSYGIALYQQYNTEIESLFESLRIAVERTGSWRFSHVSHWLPVQYYALKGDICAATAARSLQLSVVAVEEPEKIRLQSVRRHSKNLCDFLNEDYSAIINDYLALGLPKFNDSKYELLTDVAVAYALSMDIERCDEILEQAKGVRQSLSALELSGIRDSLFMEAITLCAIGRCHQARRLSKQYIYNGYTPRSPLFERALNILCDGPPFLTLQSAVEDCLSKPFIGLLALLTKRVIERKLLDYSSPLTPAETEILRLLGRGMSNKEIAGKRNRSEETVKRQAASLYRKLGVENRTRAVAVARERGLL